MTFVMAQKSLYPYNSPRTKTQGGGHGHHFGSNSHMDGGETGGRENLPGLWNHHDKISCVRFSF